MIIMGIGIDALQVKRFDEVLKRHGDNFIKRIFTQKELDHAVSKRSYSMHMAGKFAAKEAVKKALPDGAHIGLFLADIEVLNQNDGKPYVVLHGRAKELVKKYGIAQVHVSISHTKDLATANAMVVKNGT